jgi:hypothetical protein
MMLAVYVAAPQFGCFLRKVFGTTVARAQQDADHARHVDCFTPFGFLINSRRTDRGRKGNRVQGRT